MSGLVPPQAWCGQTQPHNPHTWVRPGGMVGTYADCAGHTGAKAAETRNEAVSSAEQGEVAPECHERSYGPEIRSEGSDV